MFLERSHRKILGPLAVSTLVLTACTAPAGAGSDTTVPYPRDYREWTHVKSMVIEEGHPLFEAFGGIHHVYANDRALAALRRGDGHYPDGAVFAFDLLEARAADAAITEGPRKILGVMHRDSRAFSETGGWGFAGFPPGSRENAVENPAASCFPCHASQARATGFVFSSWRE